MHPVIFMDTSCGVEFMTMSTRKSDKTREVDGTTYYEVAVEISSASHPFYTGKQVLLDTARRVEKFQKRKDLQASTAGVHTGKKAKRAKRAAAKTQEEDAK
ncbi:MAG: 50S ribosomal protein L31 [Candidatus Magasanikbacteria bacterium]|nr:50S ribosomal protein L31 [Candidatus Magasanikbacteria bacterium]